MHLTMGTVKQTPTTEIGPYNTQVPFHRELYIAETTLTSFDTLIPVYGPGYPKKYRPILGAKTIYRLIGDGTAIPGFDPLFKKTFDSFNYNNEIGVVNLITFVYDGTDFRYTIAPETIGYEFPRQVGNFGLGRDLMTLVGHNEMKAILQLIDGQKVAFISVFNTIKSIHYVGSKQILYHISKDGITWDTDLDPKQARLAYSCAEQGTCYFYVKVSEYGGTLESNAVNLSVQIYSDIPNFCLG
jgi:hypothetical protein